MVGGFRKFLTRSNALALAIGVIIGGALGAVVNSLVNDIIMPPIGYALGGVDFASLKIVLEPATGGDPATEVAIRYGLFINTLIVFVIVALVVYLIAMMFAKDMAAEPEPEPTKTCPFCQEGINPAATRCKFCGSEQPAA
jgi:large conductance mechanosensitive channel